MFLEGGRGIHFVHSRSHMAVDPRIRTVRGRSTLGFHQPGRHREHQVRGTVRCSASRTKGGLHLTKNHL